MSGYRPIYKRIWKDPDFQELSAIDKLIFIYLCTNEATTESGIYPLTATTAANETGIDITTVRQQFNNGFYKNVIYDKEKKMIYVRKIRKYNTGGRPEFIYKSIANEYVNYPSTFLWDEFFKDYEEYKGLANGLLTVPQPTDTIKYSLSISNNIDNGSIYKIFEENFQKLTQTNSEQIGDMIDTYGADKVMEAMKIAIKNNKRSLAYVEGILKPKKVSKKKEIWE